MVRGLITSQEILNFTEKEITSQSGHQIMMDWEESLMREMADEVCRLGGDILEVGFGMGISANRIQQNKIKSHTIVEINKQVYDLAEKWSTGKNVNLINCDFLEFIEKTEQKFDGIFFDPFPSEILGVGDDEFTYGKVFFDKIKKLCKDNCLVVPFLPVTSKNLDYLIDYVPLKSITKKEIVLDNYIHTQYFRGSKVYVYVFNI